MAPSALPPMTSVHEISARYEHDSTTQDHAENGGVAKKKKKNRRRGGKKFKNARAAGLEEESTLMNVHEDKEVESTLDGQSTPDDDAEHHHHHPSHTAKALPVQSISSQDLHDSATEHTDVEAGTDGEDNVNDYEATWTTHMSKKPGSKFDTTSDAWSKAVDGNYQQRVEAYDASNLPSPSDTKRRIIDWFHAQSKHPYGNLGRILRERAIDHVHNFKYPDAAPEDWKRQVRLMIWRAVVRANFWWKNPDTGVEEGKPQPVLRPAGVFENSFDAFVECAAERLDRVGRDLPDPEHVTRVEREVREFLGRAEKAGAGHQLQHLAFLLLFDEEQRKSALGLFDMQERIRRSIAGNAIDWKGLEFMRRGKPAGKGFAATNSVVMADAVWKDVGTRVVV